MRTGEAPKRESSLVTRARRVTLDDVVLPGTDARSRTATRILQAAVVLFAEQGFHGTSIREIAAAVDVRPASLYAHFASKDHILAELVTIGHEEHAARLRGAVLDGAGSLVEQFRATCRAHVLFHCEFSTLAVVGNAEMHCLPEELAGPGLTLRSQSAELVREIVQRGCDRGDMVVVDVFLTCAAIGSMGLRVAHWIRDHPEYEFEQVADTYAEFALRIVGLGSLRATG